MIDVVSRLNAALEDRYSVERKLGEGGMATVYLARDLRHDREVALKVLDPRVAEAVGAERFLEEIRMTAGLQHPHILPLHDSGESEGVLYYVMPFAEGESLRERLDRERMLPIDEAVRIATNVASALDFAHRHGVIHRDVKPENILLLDGEAMVADFGIALAARAGKPSRLTEADESLGTPLYMSPEQATGEPIDARSDIYALGCVLYEMLTGQPPFEARTRPALVAKMLTERPVSPRMLRDTISVELDAVIMRSLARVPADRYPTSDAFGTAIESATAAATPGGISWPRFTVLMGAVAIVAVSAGVYIASRPGAQPERVLDERQLTFLGDVQGASMSPQGDFVSYITSDGTTRRLYVQEVSGGNPVPIDSLTDLLCCVAWSPDGSRIAYQRGSRSAGATVVAARLGGDFRVVGAEVALAWSDDGERLLSWWPAAEALTISDLASAEIVDSVPLGTEHDWVNGADWSPDGSMVAVALRDSVGQRIRTLAVDGTVIEDLVQDTAASSPRWADDGSGVYFARGGEIWKVPVSDEGRSEGDPRVLLTGAPLWVLNSTIPAYTVSQDGSRLVYNRYSGYANLWRFSGFDGTGGEPEQRVQLTRGTANRSTPRLSPDGEWVAYVETADGQPNLFIMPAAGGAGRQVTFLDGVVGSPAWSPDGSMVAVAGRNLGEFGLWIVDLASGSARRAPVGDFEGDEVVWAPRSDILYQSRDHTAIRAVDPTTWQARDVLPAQAGSWWYDLRLTQNGSALILRRTGDRSGLWRLDVETGELDQLLDVPSGAIGWGPDAGSVLSIPSDGRTNMSREILRVSLRGGEGVPYLTLPLGQAVNPLQLTLGPDRRSLIASVSVGSTDVWVVDGFDPR